MSKEKPTAQDGIDLAMNKFIEGLCTEEEGQRNRLFLIALGCLHMAQDFEPINEDQAIQMLGVSAIISCYLQDWDKVNEFYNRAKMGKPINTNFLAANANAALQIHNYKVIAMEYSNFKPPVREIRKMFLQSIQFVENSCKHTADLYVSKYKDQENPHVVELFYDTRLMVDLANRIWVSGIQIGPEFYYALLDIPWAKANKDDVEDSEMLEEEISNLDMEIHGFLALLPPKE